MSVVIDFSPADMRLVEAQAMAGNISVEEFSRAAVMKAARNAQYLAMLDESERQLREWRVIVKTMAELEAMAAE